jgi:S-adenosylmethionine-dependent methyltransferase
VTAYTESFLCAAEAPLFDEVGSAYAKHLRTLRGLVRNHVTRANLALHLEGTSGRRAIDVGSGPGGDALWLAGQGIDVVMVEPSGAMRKEARANLKRESDRVKRRVEIFAGDHCAALDRFGLEEFDVVLCHGVLIYQDDPQEFIGGLRRLCAPNGLISLTTKNARSLAFRPALGGDYSTAYELLVADRSRGSLGVDTRAHTLQQLADWLFESRLLLANWYGIRVFTDHLADAEPSENSLEEILLLEMEASREEPYKHAARLLHVVAQRME